MKKRTTAALTTLLVGAVAAPASAETWVKPDQHDDGTTNLDLTRVRIDNGGHRFRGAMQFDTVRRDRLRIAGVIFNRRGWGSDSFFFVGERYVRERDRMVRGLWRVVETNGGVRFTRVRCDVDDRWIVWGDGRERLAFGLPQRCLGTQAGPQRVIGFAELRGGAEDLVPEYFSRLIVRG